jgi:hypothetical protein
MMKLKSILESIEDFDDSPMPGMNNGRVLSLPNTKFVISVFAEEKKLLFTPDKHDLLPMPIINFVYKLQEYFNVSKINSKEHNIFEVCFDPRQDFDQVMLFIQEEAGVDQEL